MSSAYKYEWTRKDGTVGRAYRAHWVGVDGKTHAKRGFDRKGDALAYARDREQEVRHGVKLDGDLTTNRVTVEAWCKQWEAGLDVRPTTASAYSYAVKRITADLGGRTLVSLRPSEMRTWRRALSSRMAPSTAEQTAAVFRIVLRAAVEDGLLTRSPLPKAKGGKSDTARVVDPNELMTLAQVLAWGAEMPSWACEMPLVAAATGLRQGELLGLCLDDVDFLRHKICVVRQLVSPIGAGRPDYGPTKTPAGVRTIPLAQEAALALARHLERYPAVDGEPIFRNRTGQRWRRGSFSETARAAKERAGLPEWVHWHALRDVMASTLIRHRTDLRAVMSIMGHTSSEETLGTYARLWADTNDEARKALDLAWSEMAALRDEG